MTVACQLKSWRCSSKTAALLVVSSQTSCFWLTPTAHGWVFLLTGEILSAVDDMELLLNVLATTVGVSLVTGLITSVVTMLVVVFKVALRAHTLNFLKFCVVYYCSNWLLQQFLFFISFIPKVCQLPWTHRLNALKGGGNIWMETGHICKTSSLETWLRKASGQNTEATWRGRRERGEETVHDH